MTIRVLLRDYPQRAVALATNTCVLIFRNNPSNAINEARASRSSLDGYTGGQSQCIVEFSTVEDADLDGYQNLSSLSVLGTLGLVSIAGDIFLCVVNAASRVASVRPGEHVQQINSVEFHCINKSDHDSMLLDQVNRYPTDGVDEDGFDQRPGQPQLEHPCLALKKLLSGGSFYYSADFDLTRRVQDRPSLSATIALDSLDRGFLWNAFMIQPLVNFRNKLSDPERNALDESRILTSAIRGFAMTITVPAASSPINTSFSGRPSALTLISRLSCRRAGTRFNARGIDDDGNVANYVETETILTAPTGLCFSYVQTRGSVPMFWEQSTGFTPGQQKISLSRSAEATQPAFDRHFAEMETTYGAIHIVNLLSMEKSGEVELTRRYQYHVRNSPLNNQSSEDKDESTGHHHLLETDYDFHAETRGLGYDAAHGIKRWLQDSAEAFVYYLSEEVDEEPKTGGGDSMPMSRSVPILQQEGVFRTNCLDCLDRTNLVQTIISQMALEEFLRHRSEKRSIQDFWVRHSTLWADNGDALSKIYAGTGALKSSFTRSGKMSLAGALADVRKSATRLYINNFEDKGRQNTIDLLLGRLMGQAPVHLFDPINDYVSAEMLKRTSEYTSTKSIHVLAGTFNLNGRKHGIKEDLSPWLCPSVDQSLQQPEIVAVGFQEIVELSPQQIMSTDPNVRLAWEEAVKRTLNLNAQRRGSEEYVLLRSGQLVGASLSVFVKASILPLVKNVEGSLKKTGMSGMAGNKGAVAIRMEVANTSICLVTAHLAAGFANYEERNQDYRTISHGLRFQRNRSIEDHDTIIWMGDFNYRIGMNNDRCRQLIEIGDLEMLYENDQLNLQMVHGKTFPHYSEARITFLPTYKYDNGTDNYDTSEKARIPAWTDRVLSKGNNLRQIHYDIASLRFSDHRPVYAIFQCTINVVDEKSKARISDELYHKRRAVVNSNSSILDAEDDNHLGEYEAVGAGLPPPSSDKRKWWLDNGMRARSAVRPPGPDYAINPARPSNPFAPTNEPDWVKVEKPVLTPQGSSSTPPTLPLRSQTVRTQPSNQQPIARKVPPTYAKASSSTDPLPPRLPSRSPSVSSTTSRLSSSTSTLRKPAPPVPSKPNTLQSPVLTPIPSSSTTPTIHPTRPRGLTSPVSKPVSQLSTTSTSSTRSASGPASTPPLPPPRRSATTATRTEAVAAGARGGIVPPSQRVGNREQELRNEREPALPPRRGTGLASGLSTEVKKTNLMDEDEATAGGQGAGRGEIKGWEALKPS